MKYSSSFLILAASVVTGLVFAGNVYAAAPHNDDLANAQVITPGASFSVSGTDGGATQEKFEQESGYPLGTLHTVWYAWTPTVTGTISITIMRMDGLVAQIGLFKGPTPDGTTYLGQNLLGTTILSSRTVEAGQEYLISIGNNDVPGPFDLVGSIVPTAPTAPAVSITATVPRAMRIPRHNGIFVVKLEAAADADLTLKYAVHGTASNGTDYQMLSGTVTVPAGSTRAQIKVKPVKPANGDTGVGTVRLRLLPGTGYTVGSPNNAIIKIVSE